MSNERNSNPIWRNVAAGVGVAAAGAVLAYFLNEVLQTPEEEEERTVATAVIATAAAFIVYNHFSEQEEPSNCNRPRNDTGSRPRRRRSSQYRERVVTNPSELRTIIADKLNSGTYECNICLDEITKQSKVASCKTCYTIYHLSCLRQHVCQSRESGKHPDCPTCRILIPSVNLQYRCFCGKTLNPSPREGLTPHTCQLICGNNSCGLVCHPGPCALKE